MNINPVAFGKIYKMEGDIEAGRKLCNYLQKNYTKFPNGIKPKNSKTPIFDDISDAKSLCGASRNANEHYIFTGKDAKKVWAYMDQMLMSIEVNNGNFEKSLNKRNDRIHKLIDSSDVQTISIEWDEKRKAKPKITLIG